MVIGAPCANLLESPEDYVHNRCKGGEGQNTQLSTLVRIYNRHGLCIDANPMVELDGERPHIGSVTYANALVDVPESTLIGIIKDILKEREGDERKGLRPMNTER